MKVVKATVKGLYVASLASALVAAVANRLSAELSTRHKKALVVALEGMLTSRAST